MKRGSWALIDRFEVPHYDDPELTYLTRWRIIETPWAALYLHRLGTPDMRPTLHDHPWGFLSIVLRGGYDEMRRDPFTGVASARRVRHVNRVRPWDAHWIERLHRTPTWTLLFVGRRCRTWGYLDPSTGVWVADGLPPLAHIWTRFDKHRYSAEFDAAQPRGKRHPAPAEAQAAS